MGRQDNDHTMVNSSIALLQERFRQLEKLLKLLSSSPSSSSSSETHDLRGNLSSMQNQQASQRNNNSLQPRLMVPSHRPGFHDDSLSLGLNLNSKQGYYDHHNYTMKSSSSPSSSSSSYSLWSSPQGASSSSRNFDSSDVDTSLHL
ncbi:vitellogenin [Arachis ipaensis]|uniref:vitellogenin n=1 Tax=Arachis ipaensis TaxID=130454 RepID=UPI0007AF581C|nr:vitellogenin [Arachis ipaensis]